MSDERLFSRPLSSLSLLLCFLFIQGGSSFELAASGFNDVVGFDFSQSFVDAANDMKNNKDLTFRVPLEAETYTEVSAMHQHNVNEEVRNRCTFQTGDACNLVNDFNNGTLGTDQFDADKTKRRT